MVGSSSTTRMCVMFLPCRGAPPPRLAIARLRSRRWVEALCFSGGSVVAAAPADARSWPAKAPRAKAASATERRTCSPLLLRSQPMSPPCARTICRTMARPIPVPWMRREVDSCPAHKTVEDRALLAGGNPDAVVSNGDGDASRSSRVERDVHRARLWRVLDGVVEQVPERSRQRLPIDAARRCRFGCPASSMT